MKRLLLIPLAIVALGGVARADEGPAPGDYRSPLRDGKCPWASQPGPRGICWQDEVDADPNLKGDISDAMRLQVQKDESATFTRNEQHVVMAYIAIWVVTAGFVLAVFLRQSKLKAEIARLQVEVAKAIEEEGTS